MTKRRVAVVLLLLAIGFGLGRWRDFTVTAGAPAGPLAARLSGGFFCTREIPLNTGVDFIGAAIRIALGEKVAEEDVTPKHFTPVIQRYAFPKPGTVRTIHGAE